MVDVLSNLIHALRCLPGIGPKSAQRMAYFLLQQKERHRGTNLARCLEKAMLAIQHCSQCNNYTEHDVCALCQDTSRDPRTLCVVETPVDIIAIEQTKTYRGYYYVLMGKISPLDGIGPNDIALAGLQQRVLNHPITEMIIAINPTLEGQTTIHFIQTAVQAKIIKISQLAHGIPIGGELEFLDANTIERALRNRESLPSPTTS